MNKTWCFAAIVAAAVAGIGAVSLLGKGHLPRPVLFSGPSTVIFDEPGIIRVIGGSDCGEKGGKGWWENIKDIFDFSFPKDVSLDGISSGKGMIVVDDEWDLPEWANRATVVLNGWYVIFHDTDHHVRTLSASLLPELVNKTLRWKAAATLADQGFDDAIDVCVYYTAFAWNSNEIDAKAVAVEPKLENVDVTRSSVDGIRKEKYAFTGNGFTPGEPVAVLPRGFRLSYVGDDHHLFQLAHGVSQTERLQPLSSVNWTATGLIKDNESRGTVMGSSATLLGGRGVSVLHRPFSINEKDAIGGTFSTCLSDSAHTEVFQETFRVRSDEGYLIPMLTGFNLSYACNDEHLRWTGAWLDRISFDATTGTLEYRISKILRDKDKKPGFFGDHDVSVLVLKRSDGGGIDPTPGPN